METSTAPTAKAQPSNEVAFNANLFLEPFWKIVLATLADAVKKGQLEGLDFNIYKGTEAQIKAFHADLDKRLSTFTKTL